MMKEIDPIPSGSSKRNDGGISPSTRWPKDGFEEKQTQAKIGWSAGLVLLLSLGMSACSTTDGKRGGETVVATTIAPPIQTVGKVAVAPILLLLGVLGGDATAGWEMANDPAPLPQGLPPEERWRGTDNSELHY
jgi:hypothetical protein